MNERREKDWKLMYQRKNKLHRAKQLGFLYPVASDKRETTQELNLLFVCSRNQWRSPTAEKIYGDKPLINARSAGTSPHARRRIAAMDIKWADIIFVMEEKHRAKIVSSFPGDTRFKEIVVLEIEDSYPYMDPELIARIVSGVEEILKTRQ
jgi:predicted protein tyrosine phosphatase